MDSESTFEFGQSENSDVSATIDAIIHDKTVGINETIDLTLHVGAGESTLSSSSKNGTIGESEIQTKYDSESTISLGSLDLPALPFSSEATIDLESEPSTEGTADFSIDDIPGSPGATIQLGSAGLTVRKSDSQHLGIGPIKGSTHTPKGGQTRVDEKSVHAESAMASISKRTLAKETGALDIPADYQVIKKLGEGGMGVVYSAIQRNLDRTVAVKAIKAGKGISEESRRKFFYEAQITGDLDHPNIVPIHDLGTNDDGTLFYSMKMVDGTPWLDVIQNKSREENIEILMKTCDAVAFAHSRNIIHRDLKPENVMLGSFGEVLVMDWGLAIDLTLDQKFGMSGTPAFMAPEMASHEVDKIGHCSDIYILGGILFQIVTGKPPHGGSTVRECLMWAMDNRIIETNIEDPLLDIARKAMETDPYNRYQSVIEFQDAIREYLRNAESIALTNRAEDLLVESIVNKDYQGFARAMFSIKDAIDLWPENQIAIEGLKKVRLAYGTCAFQRADYDLCLETLDTSVPEEKSIYDSALDLKNQNLQKEQRFKALRRILAGVILFAGISLSIATLYARRQAQIARQQEANAKAATVAERAAKENEAEAKVAALQQKEIAVKAAADEKAARQNEELAKQQAQADRDKAIAAQVEERKAKEQESMARSLAVAAEQKATQNALIANRNARQALIGNYQSQLNLALTQNAQFDVSRSNQLLSEIKTLESQLSDLSMTSQSSTASGPLLQNWAFRRIQLLNNTDLPITHVDGTITALEFSRDQGIGVFATSLGEVQIFRAQDNKIVTDPKQRMQFSAPVVALGIAPNSQEVIICTEAKQSSNTMYRWRFVENTVTPIEVIGRRTLQKIAYSQDGRWIVGGINGGIWKWDRTSDPQLTKPVTIDFRGKLVSLQILGDTTRSDQAFFTSILPNGSVSCAKVNLIENSLEIVALPEDLARRVTTAAVVPSMNAVLLGFSDGNLAIGPNSESPSSKLTSDFRPKLQFKSVAYRQEEESGGFALVLPKRHLTAVRSIQVFKDGAIATSSDEPVVNVWSSSPAQASIVHRLNLVGLPSNIASKTFLENSDNLVAADDKGNLLAWNISQQERRQQVVRESVPSPVIGSATYSSNSAFSMDESGVLQRWSLVDGKRTPVTNNSLGFSYYGHTPGAIVTDYAIATEKSLVATVAMLSQKSILYSDDSNQSSSELCLWDLESRQMIFRLPLKTNGDCRIAFADNDKSIVIGDSKKTIIVKAYPDDSQPIEKPFGTHLVVPNPSNSSLVALLAPTGALRLLDLNEPATWNNDGLKYLDIAINSRNSPLSAAWTLDGKRLFVIFDDGKIARIDWNGSILANLVWSQPIDELKIQEQDRPWRHLDFRVNSDGITDELEIAIRQPRLSSSSSRSTTNTTIVWLENDLKPKSSQTSIAEKTQWSGTRTSSPIDYQSISGMLKIANDPFAVFEDGKKRIIVLDGSGYFIVRNPDSPMSTWAMGRTSAKEFSVSALGNRWLSIQNNGIVLLCDIDEHGDPRWRALRHDLGTFLQGDLSSDGSTVALVASSKGSPPSMHLYKITDTPELELVFTRAEISLAKWHPIDQILVTVNAAYQLELINSDLQVTSLASDSIGRKSNGESRVKTAVFFRESWSTQKEPTWHVAVQVDGQDSSKLHFINISGSASDFAPLELKNRIASVASSTRENVLAIGDVQGNLSIWFAAPSIDRAPRELFTLPGHRGSSIDSLRFTFDGSGLFSSDSARQNLFWKSID